MEQFGHAKKRKVQDLKHDRVVGIGAFSGAN
jgi:hypothetical protein